MKNKTTKKEKIIYNRKLQVDLSRFTIDYAVHKPEIIEQIKNMEPDIIKKEVQLSWDCKQLTLRIPTEMSEEMGLTKMDKVVFTLVKPIPGSGEKPHLTMEIKHA